nr:MAG TPA: hypothetical protein [Caudoviricetes sp.]DAT27497.1 MAG TPA: hypothetical protein [Caudoviricetes sp.]
MRTMGIDEGNYLTRHTIAPFPRLLLFMPH